MEKCIDMILQKNKVTRNKFNCSFKDLIRIEYSRERNKIYIVPCGCLNIINWVEPFAFDPEYFINNLEECLNKYINYDKTDLCRIYTGRCTQDLETHSINQLCNYKISEIKNIEVSISRYCNYNCKKCIVHFNEKNNYEESLYMRIINKFKSWNLDLFTFTCNGEPFLYKDLIYDFLENNNSKKVRFITNGSLLTEQDIKKLALYKDKLELWVSVDSLDKEQYNQLTNTNNFEIVSKNLKLLLDEELIGLVNCVIYSNETQDLNKIKKFFNGINITFLKNANEL